MSIQQHSEAAVPDDTWAELHILSREEARQLFDEVARKRMGLSGDEFVRRWRAGEYEGRDEPGIRDVEMLLPLVVRLNLDGSDGGSYTD